MRLVRYIVRVIVQTVIIGAIFYFVSLDAKAQFRPSWNWFDLWLMVSWGCQFFIMHTMEMVKAYESIRTAGLEKIQAEEAQTHGGIDRYLKASQSDLEVQHERLQLQDHQFGFMANLCIRILYALLGPVVVPWMIIRNRYH